MERTKQTFTETLLDALFELGIRASYGIVGGGIAPFAELLLDSGIDVYHFRHESGAAFAAAESYFISEAPVLVFTTTGPGFYNALNGIAAARWEGAKLLVVSGCSGTEKQGRWAFQESGRQHFSVPEFFRSGGIFDYATMLEHESDLEVAVATLAKGFAKPGGFVAHLGMPLNLQRRATTIAPPQIAVETTPPMCDAQTLERCAELLSNENFVIWAGFGARRAAGEVLQLAEKTQAPVMCSPRGKGIIPENHPLYLGVSGFGGHPELGETLQRFAPAHALVLGSRLGEFTSFWSPNYLPTKGLIHVDIDDNVFAAAFPRANVLGIRAEIGAFLRALQPRLPGTHLRRRLSPPVWPRPPQNRPSGPVRTAALMGAIQRHIVDTSDAVIITEAGNAFAWGSSYLAFKEPRRYRTSMGFGSMGQASTGVVGAAMIGNQKAVALLGDGAMLMNHEISTAVQYAIPAVWIVLNDQQYGMIDQGMRAQGFRPVQTQIPEADFVAIARAVGADGIRVTEEGQLDDALKNAMAATGPFVVDVLIDRDEKAPVLSRVKSLAGQGALAIPRKE